MTTGQHGGFWWIESSDHFLSDLVRRCPNLFVGRHIHVTSFDSSPLRLAPDELASGWIQHGDVAISPKVETVDILPLTDYSEWYVYDHEEFFANHENFESNGAFSLTDPNYLLDQADPTWDQVGIRQAIDYRLDLQDRFWAHMGRLQPIAYFGDGEHLTTVTTVRNVYDTLREVLAAT